MHPQSPRKLAIASRTSRLRRRSLCALGLTYRSHRARGALLERHAGDRLPDVDRVLARDNISGLGFASHGYGPCVDASQRDGGCDARARVFASDHRFVEVRMCFHYESRNSIESGLHATLRIYGRLGVRSSVFLGERERPIVIQEVFVGFTVARDRLRLRDVRVRPHRVIAVIVLIVAVTGFLLDVGLG